MHSPTQLSCNRSNVRARAQPQESGRRGFPSRVGVAAPYFSIDPGPIRSFAEPTSLAEFPISLSPLPSVQGTVALNPLCKRNPARLHKNLQQPTLRVESQLNKDPSRPIGSLL